MGSHDDRTDAELMEAHAGGDEEAFEALFRRYVHRLFGFLYHMTGNRETAQDLLQEVFFRVHRARSLYDPSRPFRPWLFGIAVNARRDLAKSWAWKLACRTERFMEGGIREPEVPGVEQGGEAGILAGRLRAELRGLPEDQRQAIVLHDLEGLTAAEVGEAMDAPLGTVLSWLRRGRAALKERLEAKGGKGAWA
jgi:RNA polymerase sigma-70 factor (ECF subfamily)